MTRHQYAFLAVLVIFMAGIAFVTGKWAESTHPDGFQVQYPATLDGASENESQQGNASKNQSNTKTHHAFTFGASMGLLAIGMVYCLISFGLLIRAKTTGKHPGLLVYCVAGLAAASFVLSHLVDDFFY